MATQTEAPLEVHSPESLTDLVSLVKRAEALQVPVVPIGAAISLSKPHRSPGLAIKTDALSSQLAVPTLSLRDPLLGSSFLRVEGGASVNRVNAILAARGKTLPTIAAFTRMSIAGALATSTHGSGIAEASMADLAVSVDVVTGRGRALRLEPRCGPTHPGRFSHPVLELVQDDDLFHSLVAGLGAMGIVHSVTLRTCDDELLEERREPTTFERVRDRIRSREFIAAHRDVAVLINPYERCGRRRASLTRIRAVRGGRPRSNAKRFWLAPYLLSRLPMGRVVAGWRDMVPSAAPSAIDCALGALSGARYQGSTGEVLGGSAHDGAVAAHAMEAAVAFEDVVPTLEAILALADSEARAGRYLRAPLSVRFTGPSRHLLSPQYGRVSATIELMSLATRRSTGAELAPYAELLLSRGGRMHFGLEVKHAGKHPGLLANIPELARWRAAADSLDQERTFVHRLVRETGLR